MKKLLIPIIIILAVILVPPPITGSHAKKQLHSLTELISQTPGYTVTWKSYNKGWFSTDAVLNLTIDTAQFDLEQTDTIDISLKFNAKHGVFLFSENQSVGLFSYKLRLLDEQTTRLENFLEYDNTKEFYSSTGAVDLTGNLTATDHLQAFALSFEENKLEFSGYDGQGTYSNNQQFNYTATIGSIVFNDKSGEDSKITESTLSIIADYSQLIAKNLAPSSMSFETDEILLTSSDDHIHINIKDYDFSSAILIAEDNKSFDIVIDMSIAEGVSNDQSFQKAKFVFGYNDIAVEFYEAYISALDNIENYDDLSPLLATELINQVLTSGIGLTAEEMSITLPNGKFSSSFDISLVPQTDLNADSVRQNPFLLTQAIMANAHVMMDQPLAEQLARTQIEQTIAQQIELQRASGQEVNVSDEELNQLVEQSIGSTMSSLIQQGFIQQNNTVYESNFSFKDGQATINGQAIPLEALLQGAL